MAFLQQLVQGAVELTLQLGRAVGTLFAACLGQQGGQAVFGGGRMMVHEIGEREAAIEQAITPALGMVHQMDGALVLFVVDDQLLPDGVGIDRTHQLADVLQLTAQALVALDSAGLGHGARQILGQGDARQLGGGQLDQALAQRLQFVHLLLAAGLADRGVVIGQQGVAGVVGGVHGVVSG